MMKLLFGVGRVLKARPFLALCLVLLAALGIYRELYHNQVNAALELEAQNAQATIDAQEIAAERRYLFMQQQQERLEQRNRELARQNQLEQAALTEIARMNEAADELVKAKRERLQQLQNDFAVLSERVPDAVVRVLQHTGAEDSNDP